ncbi:GIY-YIG nuclease family protein [Mucilaginibacter paludis]|uniref:Excinuclease ABC C subunit domain protein n=1 Tax=Mucilaginibacter paludis DSM 18603 TaxID=714943 RepID=H1YCV4_9SPHI|nr:GIY-YIG nuclease family protein [Mucilaginibacter paludis]EHQ25125.1 Excinuclease ABC C subunit domain protein [Mucilaginibacter paludis DSM 18603]
MLRTIISDAYKWDERDQIVAALDTLCNPNDTYGWASAGIYCYWNYETKEILYVGLAVDLTERFKQHNDYYPSIDPRGCKVEQVKKYFNENEKLGFSIVVQSPLSQPSIRKVREQFSELFEENELASETGQSGIDEIQRLEGFLIESFLQINKVLPSWNKIGGSVRGRRSVKPSNKTVLRILASHEAHYLAAKSTLREIAASAKLERYENYLHAVRMFVPFIGAQRAFDLLDAKDPVGTYGHIMSDNYLQKLLTL